MGQNKERMPDSLEKKCLSYITRGGYYKKQVL